MRTGNLAKGLGCALGISTGIVSGCLLASCGSSPNGVSAPDANDGVDAHVAPTADAHRDALRGVSPDASDGRDSATPFDATSDADAPDAVSRPDAHATDARAVDACTPPSDAGVTFDVNDPKSDGYELVFDDEFDSASTIDLQGTGAAGYNWSTKRFFGYANTPASYLAVSGGVLTITVTGSSSDANYQIATAFPASNARGWSGHSFGGGAYFEASLSFDASGVKTASGWPSYWSASVESWANKGATQWPGQPTGYNHAIEYDFFEYDIVNQGPDVYGASLHDWYGIYKSSCAPAAYCSKNNANAVIHAPASTNWSDFHTISELWVSGATNCGNGYVQNYFDGVLMSRNTWVDSGSGSPPPSGSFIFSILDQDHLNIVLGSGVNQPLKVDYVHVWQLPSAATASGNAVVTPETGFNGK